MSSPSEPQLRDPLLATLGGDRCPACGAPVKPRIALGDYDLFRCGECESWCSDARVRGASTTFSPDAYFDNAGDDRDKWETLVKRLREVTLTSLLEVGCGEGRGLELLIEKADAYAGVDKITEVIDRLSAKYPDATMIQGNIPPFIMFEDDTFDCVVTFQVIEHIKDDKQFLQEIQRVIH